jgi:hypothetical protein
MVAKLNDWIDFIQKPRPELGGLAICPYAKQAVVLKTYKVETTTTAEISTKLAELDLVNHQVIILIVEDYEAFKPEELVLQTIELNKQHNSKDLAILDNDPRTPMIINGVTTTFAHSYLWIVQSLSDLNKKSEDLKKTNYYDFWTQAQLSEVVTWRT